MAGLSLMALLNAVSGKGTKSCECSSTRLGVGLIPAGQVIGDQFGHDGIPFATVALLDDECGCSRTLASIPSRVMAEPVTREVGGAIRVPLMGWWMTSTPPPHAHVLLGDAA
jgi:hypothetical protein